MTYLHKAATFATVATMMASTLITPVFAATDEADGLLEAGDLGLDQIRKGAGFGKKSIYQTVGDIIKIALTLVGIIAIVLVIYGGFKWMTAGGSEEKVDEAKKILYSGAIGLVIIFSAYALTTFVLGTLLKATGAEGFTGI
jgi:hypothetical protein